MHASGIGFLGSALIATAKCLGGRFVEPFAAFRSETVPNGSNTAIARVVSHQKRPATGALDFTGSSLRALVLLEREVVAALIDAFAAPRAGRATLVFLLALRADFLTRVFDGMRASVQSGGTGPSMRDDLCAILI
jgi:hypothetical protein